MIWKGFGLTHIGHVRQLNQDAFGIYDHLGLWLIADGMGGHAGGEVASQLAIQEMAAYFEKHQEGLMNHPTQSKHSTVILQETLEAANFAIRKHAQEHFDLLGMGTTAVAIHIPRDPPFVATIAHAGDSRAYLLRNQQLSVLTRDHSLVEERIALGILTPEQALSHPLRHVLTRALGIEHSLTPTVATLEIIEGDRILLCTDGLTKMMTDEHIFQTVQRTMGTLEQTCLALVEEANDLGGEDNVTVVMIGSAEF